jgi:hypothetical protein
MRERVKGESLSTLKSLHHLTTNTAALQSSEDHMRAIFGHRALARNGLHTTDRRWNIIE